MLIKAKFQQGLLVTVQKDKHGVSEQSGKLQDAWDFNSLLQLNKLRLEIQLCNKVGASCHQPPFDLSQRFGRSTCKVQEEVTPDSFTKPTSVGKFDH